MWDGVTAQPDGRCAGPHPGCEPSNPRPLQGSAQTEPLGHGSKDQRQAGHPPLEGSALMRPGGGAAAPGTKGGRRRRGWGRREEETRRRERRMEEPGEEGEWEAGGGGGWGGEGMGEGGGRVTCRRVEQGAGRRGAWGEGAGPGGTCARHTRLYGVSVCRESVACLWRLMCAERLP